MYRYHHHHLCLGCRVPGISHLLMIYSVLLSCVCVSFENNRLNGPELKGLVPYDFGC
uniref:Uncharacterized protein n=1 Tax=Rhizophora mucronata TaxID=61149 RepID=A0A2P2KXR8_RHIMU